MNVLIIGSKGQLAKELKNSLKLKKLKFFFINKQKVDIVSYNSLNSNVKKKNPSIIINCAAYTDVDNSEIKKKAAYNINCNGVKNLVKICKNKKIYLIHFSTDYVFDGKGKKYKENDKTKPINYYGKTKEISEQMIMGNLKSYVIFRLSWLMGNYSNNFLKKIVSLLKNNKELHMVNDQIGNPTMTFFVSKIIRICCENFYNKKNIFNGIYHLANEPSLSKLKFTEYVYCQLKQLKLTKNNCKIIGVSSKKSKSKAKRPRNSSFNLNKIKSKIRSTNFSWKLILNKTLKNINEK